MPDFFNTSDVLNMPGVVTEANVAAGYMPPQPRIYREIGSSLPLTTSWQRLDLSVLNANTFPVAGANRLVDWNSSSKVFTFNDSTTRNYIAALNMSIATSGVLVTPIVIPIKVQFRFVVPNGVSPGVDYYFPFSTSAGYMDLKEVAWNGGDNVQRLTPVTSDLPKRVNGVGCDVRLSSSPLTGGISASAFSIYMFGS
jgi:hypothetical protein